MTQRWRTGHKLGRTLYIGDDFVGMMDTPELAASVARAMNAQPVDCESILETDLRIDVFTSGVSIPGSVLVTHLPTGLTASSSDRPSTLQNKTEALKLLAKLLETQHRQPR